MVDQLYNNIVIRDLEAKIAELENYQLQAQDDLTRMSAHIERLREGIILLRNTFKIESQYNDASKLLRETPKQSLATNNAEVIMKFKEHYMKGLLSCHINAHQFDEYADKLREGTE